MLKPSYTKQFERDLKKVKKRGKNIKKLTLILSDLIDEKKLEEKYLDHKLIANYIKVDEIVILNQIGC